MPAHIDEDTLDHFATNQLPEAGLAPVQEHMLVCPDHRGSLAEIGWFLADRNFTLEPM
jgi:hypothetical protein